VSTRGETSKISERRRQYQRYLAACPSPTLAENNFYRLVQSNGAEALEKFSPDDLASLFGVLGGSSFLSEILIRQGAEWPDLFRRQIKNTQKEVADHLKELSAISKQVESFDDFCAALRQHKQREYLRIGGRDLMPSVTMEETVRELTVLADASLEAAYQYCRAEVEKDFGQLNLPTSGVPNGFVVIGMGKLGGGELNFSSDIDVIFLYENDEGETNGGRKGKTGAREFFNAVGQKIIKAMGDVTEDGFVFRTDLRLRPLGINGPLVQSLDSAMLYYESWGQCWERAAMIKARPVAGAIELGTQFLKELEPFIYRRYLDYTTVDELRHMKERIENELLIGDEKTRNLKLGYGGIREIEFFTQALQLVNGGYEPELRRPSTLPALMELAKRKFITIEERDRLSEAYHFLRQAEHKVQIVQEGHVHSIPDGEAEEQAYARRLGYIHQGKLGERELFWRDHRRYTNTVRNIFDRLFYRAQKDIENEGASVEGSIWNDLDNQQVITKHLAHVEFSDPEKAYENLLAVRDGESYSPPSAKRLKIMRTLGPALIAEIAKSGAPDQALFNLASFSHRIGGRTGFLTLLAENPETMRLLITLFADSQFLTDLFLKRPELIDTLIRVDLTRIDKSKNEMLTELQTSLAAISEMEDKLNALRRYKNEEFIRIGLHDLGGSIDFLGVVRQLSDLAEACLQAALNLTLADLGAKFGEVSNGRFAIIGGGKMGAREIDYNSDLDLVFIYDATEEAETTGGSQGRLPAHEYYVRIGQRLPTYLSAPTEEGIAYKIDMQLRPSGKAGPIVCSVDAYREYHKSTSQLWERQALIKTRFIAGDELLGRVVESVIEQGAYSTGLTQDGVAEIHRLRMRMERELAGEDESRFNLKKGRGGLVDIEFLTQMLQLTHGYRIAAVRQRGTLTALKALEAANILKAREYQLLADGYLFLRQLDHRLRLERDQSIDAFVAEPGRVDGVAKSLGYRNSGNAGSKRVGQSGRKLLRDYQQRREKIRKCYERYFLAE
jgi:glutamate-ammonia-ligase adenylyltransferase